MGKLYSLLSILVSLLVIFALVLSIFENGSVLAQKNGERDDDFVADELIVKYKGDKEPFRVVKLSSGKRVRDAEREFEKRGDVVFAEPNYIAHAFMIPNDPFYKYQWHFDNAVYGGINAQKAWDLSGGVGVTVAVVDTGVAYENYSDSRGRYYKASDFGGTAFVSGYDFVYNDTHANDDNGHGTHVAGTVAQTTNNSLGVAGVAFKAAIMPIKVLDKNGSGTYANVAKGIKFAADKGAKVINLSLGGSSPSQTLLDAVSYAYSKGSTVVAASGNDGKNVVAYPAGYDQYVMAIGATRFDETLAYYSNFGSSLDLVAPGGDLGVDQNGDGYADGVLQQTFQGRTSNLGYYFFQGTSMATPHVSAVAALVIANGNATAPDEVRTILQQSAEDLGSLGRDDTYGWGLVNAAAALGLTSPSPSPSPTPTPLPSPSPSPTPSPTPTPEPNPTPTPSPSPTPSPAPSPTPTPTPPAEIEVFLDSFEINEWNGFWTEDSQNDWFRSSQRATEGNYSAEVDGSAADAKLTSVPINLQGKTNATITFSWLIESGLDSGEYVAFDVSTDGGNSWTERAKLSGNVSQENVWHNANITLTGINNLQIRFRGKMSGSDEDANVDLVRAVVQ